MSFHEKSAWACLVALLFVYVPYFGFVLTAGNDFVSIVAFIVAVVVLIVILSLSHAALALSTRQVRKTGDVPAPDEMERGIESRATWLSSLVFGIAVVNWCLAAYMAIPYMRLSSLERMENAANLQDVTPQLIDTMASGNLLLVHALFAAFVFSNIVYYAAIVYGYRKAA